MRIRKRPQLPLSSPGTSDPSTASISLQTSPNARKQQCFIGEEREAGLHPNGDLMVDPHGLVLGAKNPTLPLPPTTNRKKVGDSSKSLDAQAKAHKSLANGRHHLAQENPTPVCSSIAKKPEPATAANANASMTTATATAAAASAMAKEEKNGNANAGIKKRRSPAVLMEGSRCSRVNGRGWRCSQPTLVGYSLCEHHLGKGRLRSVSSGGARGGGQLGRTEPRKLTASVAPSPPKAEEPGLRHC